MTDSEWSQEPDQLLEYWQERLRLRDWRITVETKRHYDMPGCVIESGNEAAHITFHHHNKTGEIKVTERTDIDPETPGIPSVEQSIVHELLHIHLTDWEPEPSSTEYWRMECAINLIADALVSLRRKEDGNALGG
jgi:hypothetical protein